MRWLALAVVLLVPLHLARADDGGVTADASVDAGVDLPDASAGEGSAQSGSEEGDTPVVCQSNADCDNGSACRNHVCVYQAPRNATTEGCSTAGLWLLPSLAVLALRRPYFLSKRTK